MSPRLYLLLLFQAYCPLSALFPPNYQPICHQIHVLQLSCADLLSFPGLVMEPSIA